MASPFETSPVSMIELPCLRLDVKGLIVVVGPNSSGKTSLLRDIHAVASGDPRTLVVVDRVAFRNLPQLDEYLTFFQESGDIEMMINQPPGTERYRKRAHQYGTQQGAQDTQWSRGDFETHFTQFKEHIAASHGKTFPACIFLQQVGLLECSALFIDQRLNLTLASGTFDTHQATPTTALQALRLNRAAQKQLTEEISSVFKRGVWLDLSGGANLPIRASDTENAPSFEERTDPELMKKFRTIETEGEGIRSYVAVCITLLLAQRPLCLIDEPEMCLHPPQARALGRFIGKYGSGPKGCTLVATHSSMVLRGILERNPQASVIRLMRSEGGFRGQHVKAESLREATTRPFSRSEVILEGLFTDGVVLCESDGDRIVYDSTLQTFTPPQPDIRFVPVGGVGGFREPIKLYRALKVPVAVIADFDFLTKPELPEVLKELGLPQDKISGLSARINSFTQKVRATKPDLSPLLAEVKELQDLQEEALLRSKLTAILRRLNRLSQLKSKGLDGVPDDLKAEVNALLDAFKAIGLFLVPRGELESWVPNLMNGKSKDNKSLWATEAARKIEEHGFGDDDIWNFVNEVVSFIRSAMV